MILVALGANLSSHAGPPQATLEAAIACLAHEGGEIVARSRFYRSPPVPKSDQPDYINAVVSIATALDPPGLLAVLGRIENRFGRQRGREPNAARPLDLDLIAYDDVVCDEPPILPHPRMHRRAFVLLPMAEIVPNWRHPRLGRTLDELIDALPAATRAETRPIEAGSAAG